MPTFTDFHACLVSTLEGIKKTVIAESIEALAWRVGSVDEQPRAK